MIWKVIVKGYKAIKRLKCLSSRISEVKPRTIEVTPEALIGMVQIVDKNSATMFNLIEKLTDLSLATQKETVIMKEQFRKSEKKRSLLQKELDFTREQLSLVSNNWRSTD